MMELLEQWKTILRIQKFRRMVSYAGFYCFVSVLTYAYVGNTTRAGMSRADQYYAAYPAGIELLTDIAKAMLNARFVSSGIWAENDRGDVVSIVSNLVSLLNYVLYKAALGNCFEEEEWGPIEFSIMAKHFERQGKPPYTYHAQYMAHLLSHGQLDGSG